PALSHSSCSVLTTASTTFTYTLSLHDALPISHRIIEDAIPGRVQFFLSSLFSLFRSLSERSLSIFPVRFPFFLLLPHHALEFGHERASDVLFYSSRPPISEPNHADLHMHESSYNISLHI